MSEESPLDELPHARDLIADAVSQLSDVYEDYVARKELGYGHTQRATRVRLTKQAMQDYPGLFEKLSSQVADVLANRCGLVGPDLQAMAHAITKDLELVLIALRKSLSDPFVSGIWICYCTRTLPTRVLNIERPLSTIIDIPKREAQKLLAEAISIHNLVANGSLGTATQVDDDIRALTAEAKGRMPGSILLQSVLSRAPHSRDDGLLSNDWKVSVGQSELTDKSAFPKTWLACLEEQENGRSVTWRRIWPEPLLHRLPSTAKFLDEYCRGIAILEQPNRPSALLYVYTVSDEGYPCGYRYGCYLGGMPLPCTTSHNSMTLSLLPPKLREFYVEVHDGWTQARMYDGGLFPLAQMRRLREEGVYSDMLEILSFGHHRFCLDVRTISQKHPKAIFWYADGAEPIVGLDLWEALDTYIELGMETLLPR